jgi:hypothetical protein
MDRLRRLGFRQGSRHTTGTEHPGGIARPTDGANGGMPQALALNDADRGASIFGALEQFFLALVVTMVIPNLALIFASYQSENLRNIALSYSVGVYALTMFVTTRSMAILAMDLLVGLSNLFVYVSIASGRKNVAFLGRDVEALRFVLVSLGLVLATHATERFIMHVIQRAPFWEIGRS